ncbi:MAG TPA: bi-domain-containing oxidoreductase [Blastocatellia bacterium]|nr:bi-domain-containing oxidoreductase [Blastocatellia bacterium]
MKQVLQNFRTGVLRVDEVPEPICKSGGILVANAASLISAGTEKMAVDLAQKSLVGKAKERPDLVRQVIGKVQKDGLASTFRTVMARLDTPLALGYSCAGVVSEVGRGADEFHAGDRVACAGMNYASHAETVFVPKNLAVRIPDNVSFDEAAFVTLGAIALQGVRTAEVKLGETVAVIGLGLLGQLTVMLLKAAGCRVLGIDLDPNKTRLALEHGADAAALRSDDVESAIAQFTGGYGADSVIITAAAESNDPIELAGTIARDRAVVSMVGAVGMNVPRKVYYEKELQLRLSRSYGPGRYDAQYEEQGIDYPIGYVRWTERRNMQEFLRLISAGAVRLDKLITHRFDISQAEAAYDIITGKTPQPYLGILLTYSEASSHKRKSNIVVLREARTIAADGTVSLGIIGAGNFAKAVLLPRLAKAAHLRLTGIATATGRNAKAIGEQYGFGFCTSDYRELLGSDNINTVLIATRHDSHARMTVEALQAGKTVFVEKPLATTEEGLNQIVEAARENRGRVMVGFNRRFSSLAAELKQALAGAGPLAITYRVNAGAIPRESWIQNDEGGGRIIGEVCHFADFLQFLTGADPVEVFAYAAATGLNDTLSIVIRFSDGSTGNINYFATGDKAFPKERIEVYGGGRVGVLDDFRVLEVWNNGKRKVTKRLQQDKGFDQELGAFIEAARTGAEMPISFRSLVLTTKVTLAVEESLGTGRPQTV